jgi:hypothetical protein
MNRPSPDIWRDHKLKKTDPYYQHRILSALKTIEWGKGKRAEVFYALLCEATHPNVGANGLYIDSASVDAGWYHHLISKECNSHSLMAMFLVGSAAQQSSASRTRLKIAFLLALRRFRDQEVFSARATVRDNQKNLSRGFGFVRTQLGGAGSLFLSMRQWAVAVPLQR